MKDKLYRMGIDVGSTTAKAVILNQYAELIFSEYHRHNAETLVTLQSILQEALRSLGDVKVNLLVTGSAGLGVKLCVSPRHSRGFTSIN
jgi:activator of 2-hydroxyglutaryl-CoA dehydratase